MELLPHGHRVIALEVACVPYCPAGGENGTRCPGSGGKKNQSRPGLALGRIITQAFGKHYDLARLSAPDGLLPPYSLGRKTRPQQGRYTFVWVLSGVQQLGAGMQL